MQLYTVSSLPAKGTDCRHKGWKFAPNGILWYESDFRQTVSCRIKPSPINYTSLPPLFLSSEFRVSNCLIDFRPLPTHFKIPLPLFHFIPFNGSLPWSLSVADNTTTTITDHETDAFGWATAGAKQIFEASSPVTAKIKLKTQPYPPGGHPIINLSFPTSATTFSTGNAFLSVTSTQCTVHNLVTFEKLYHVDTMDCHTVKQAMYLPSFDFVLLGICGDDTLRVWGMDIGSTEEDLSHAEDTGMHQSSGFRRRFEVIAMREEFLQQRRAEAAVTLNLKRSTSSENVIESLRKDFSQGYLTAVACSRIPGRVIVATLDSTLIVFSTNDGDFQVKRVLRLANEVYVTKIDFLLSELPEADLVICRTSVGDLVVIDLMALPNGDENRQEKPKLMPVIPFLVVEGNCEGFAFSPNYKLFAVQTKLGELDLYSMDFILRRMEKELDKRNALREGGGKKKKAHLSKEQVDSVHREVRGKFVFNSQSFRVAQSESGV